VALRGRGFVSVGAVVACCALASACSLDQSPASTPSPTPVAITPAESQIERQMRLDYEAAEEAYRANMAEQDRQSQLGIAVKTEELTSSASDNYLVFVLQVLRDIRDSGWRARGTTTIRGVARGGWKEGQVRLSACEDNSAVTFVDKDGKDVTPKNGVRTYVQDLTVNRVRGGWKVSDVESRPVKNHEGVPCGA
jgi:hypothetical protein